MTKRKKYRMTTVTLDRTTMRILDRLKASGFKPNVSALTRDAIIRYGQRVDRFLKFEEEESSKEEHRVTGAGQSTNHNNQPE